MINILLAILTSFVITFFVTPILIRVIRNNDALMHEPEFRGSHKNPIPVFGGVAIFFSILFAIIFWIDLSFYKDFQPILSALLVVFLIGLLDDFAELSPVQKIVGQLIAIFIMIFFSDLRITSFYGILSIHTLPYWISVLFTAFTMVVIINAYNLIDGLDGLAASIGLLSSLIFGILFLCTLNYQLVILSWSVSASLLAFLYYNFHPAKIFMGDTGSMIIGFLLSIFAVNIVNTDVIIWELDFEAKGSALAIAILIVPLYDSLRVFLIRVLNGGSPMQADRNHIHHGLSDLGFGHRRTTMYICLANILVILLVILLQPLGINYIILCIIISVLLLNSIPYLIKKNRKS